MRQRRVVAGKVFSFRLARHPPGLAPGRVWHLAAIAGRLPRRQRAGSLSLSRCGAGRARFRCMTIQTEVELRQLVEQEASAANAATPALTEDAVAAALVEAGQLARER